jgi:3-oxoacyl-[acyl-carrier-protein] synthase II
MAHIASKRVVITGLGVVAPNGIGKEAFWSSLLNGQSGIGPITLFDASQHTCKIAGEVPGFELNHFLDLHDVRVKRLSRQTQLTLVASILALRDAGLTTQPANFLEPLQLVLGISSSAIEVITQGYDRLLAHGAKRVPTHTVQACQPQQSASVVAGYLRCTSRTQTISSACAAGLDAIAAAYRSIRSGAATVALTGGADAPVNDLTFACLAQAGLIGASAYPPEKASRPFDKGHTVGIISEGAGLLVLEEWSHARARGARMYAEVTGYGTYMDENFDRPGCGYETAIREALSDARRRPEDIDYVCAHGPSHVVLDCRETEALHVVLGDHARHVAISSIKGVTGNPLAAAGGLQAIATALAIEQGMIPPTANLEQTDPACDLDYVPLQPRRARVRAALINTHGLGNGNSALIMEPVTSP